MSAVPVISPRPRRMSASRSMRSRARASFGPISCRSISDRLDVDLEFQRDPCLGLLAVVLPHRDEPFATVPVEPGRALDFADACIGDIDDVEDTSLDLLLARLGEELVYCREARLVARACLGHG